MPWDIEVQDRLLLRGGVGIGGSFPLRCGREGLAVAGYTTAAVSTGDAVERLSLRATYGIRVSVCAAINAATGHRKHREHPAPICAPTTRGGAGLGRSSGSS
jgi:hypothetical protein